ncbi:ABC transporter permease [Microbispora sp. GKU 823]|uniref:ABC transporter permease n=1 Tax=Microbispora sp. GKU 823 TaxID=1652100 RepID=UPI00211957D9|nr:ABC transporter permease [Microbispora sp. GKU 823]
MNIRVTGSRRWSGPWIWGFAAAALVWLVILAISGQGGGQTVSLALSLAPYLVIVGLGQMLVITAGPGNIDVSVGSVISLAGFVSVAAASATGSAAVGILAGIGVGVLVAAVSAVAILGLSVPPIIATLAAGLVASSITLSMANGFTAVPDPGLRSALNLRPAGVPLLALAIAVLTVLVVALLRRTVYGRSLIAVGQSRRAAERAGIPVARIIGSTYLLSGALAGLTGALLAAYIAPSADLGTRYLLDSVAVVVIGGTLISGAARSRWACGARPSSSSCSTDWSTSWAGAPRRRTCSRAAWCSSSSSSPAGATVPHLCSDAIAHRDRHHH